MRTYRNCYMLFPASFKLVVLFFSCMHHPLPCFASYRLASYLVGHLVMFLCCVFTLLCAFFSLVLSVAIVRICSTTRGSSSRLLLRLLHGFILLPCGISGRMTITLDTFTIIAMLSCLDAIVICRATNLFVSPSPCCHETSNLDTFPAKPLFGYVTRLLSTSYSVASCR